MPTSSTTPAARTPRSSKPAPNWPRRNPTATPRTQPAASEEATNWAEDLHRRLGFAQQHAITAEKQLSTCESNLASARQRLNEARPSQTATRAHLAALLVWPPLAQALGAEPSLHAGGADGSELLDTVEGLLGRRSTVSKKTLGERYDTVRAELAQTWTIARDDPPAGIGELDTFVLTHADLLFTEKANVFELALFTADGAKEDLLRGWAAEPAPGGSCADGGGEWLVGGRATARSRRMVGWPQGHVPGPAGAVRVAGVRDPLRRRTAAPEAIR
ncbi:hypothetical protein ACFRCW_40995 [Streptomyces sp. NPDC056653]|uniref:hypothetical protein n=1 Tax=Streptomyces sp. NPDC056653 TaxID=3345894 RepID=UPI00367B2B77